jgi:hypothetical protein
MVVLPDIGQHRIDAIVAAVQRIVVGLFLAGHSKQRRANRLIQQRQRRRLIETAFVVRHILRFDVEIIRDGLSQLVVNGVCQRLAHQLAVSFRAEHVVPVLPF